MRCSLEVDPDKRATSQDLLKHAFLYALASLFSRSLALVHAVLVVPCACVWRPFPALYASRLAPSARCTAARLPADPSVCSVSDCRQDVPDTTSDAAWKSKSNDINCFRSVGAFADSIWLGRHHSARSALSWLPSARPLIGCVFARSLATPWRCLALRSRQLQLRLTLICFCHVVQLISFSTSGARTARTASTEPTSRSALGRFCDWLRIGVCSAAESASRSACAVFRWIAQSMWLPLCACAVQSARAMRRCPTA